VGKDLTGNGGKLGGEQIGAASCLVKGQEAADGRYHRTITGESECDMKVKEAIRAANYRLLLAVSVKIVVIAFHALTLHFKERFNLGIFNNLGHAMIYRPDSTTDAALGNAFLEAV
jgi:hypothetical protein